MADSNKNDKPITITLFYAEWCNHCHSFLPVWDKMVNEKKTEKNFRFVKVEEVEIPNLPEEMRMVEGDDVRNIGYPTIKISVNGHDYQYNGRRTARDIYQSIIDTLSESEGKIDGKVSVKLNDNKVSIESSPSAKEDVPLPSEQQTGGNGKNTKLRVLNRLINDNELKL